MARKISSHSQQNIGYRNANNWRYRLIKKYKRRAQKFHIDADSFEERKAWGKVVDWFTSILNKKYLSENNTIRLPSVEL